MNIIPANVRFNAMVDSWSACYCYRSTSSTLPTVIFEGHVDKDELSSQSTYEVGMKVYLPRYEELFCNQMPIEEE